MAFNPFGQLGEMKKMRDQAMAMQRELQMETVEISKRGVYILSLIHISEPTRPY